MWNRIAVDLTAAMLLCISLGLCQTSPAQDRERYLRDQEQDLREEYYRCTDDTAKVTLAQIMRWKKDFHDKTQTDEYRTILRQYVAETGNTTNVYPCFVLAWNDARRAQIARQEVTMSRNTLTFADTLFDSLNAISETESDSASRYDFTSIPFGMSQRGVKYLYRRLFRLDLTYEHPFLYTKEYMIGATPFTVAFHFDKQGRYYKYEFEGRDASPDSLDAVVRRQVSLLAEMLRKRLGAPLQTLGVGRFDIKPGRLAPTARWLDRRHEADVGIGVYANRFYAKAIVSCILPLPPIEPTKTATSDTPLNAKTP
jgi:hypothetical protein